MKYKKDTYLGEKNTNENCELKLIKVNINYPAKDSVDKKKLSNIIHGPRVHHMRHIEHCCSFLCCHQTLYNSK